MLRAWSNCLIFAGILIWRSRWRDGLGIRRSEGLHGTAPHAFIIRLRGFAMRRGRDRLLMLEYVPDRRHISRGY